MSEQTYGVYVYTVEKRFINDQTAFYDALKRIFPGPNAYTVQEFSAELASRRGIEVAREHATKVTVMTKIEPSPGFDLQRKLQEDGVIQSEP
ncbi:hypothetical protein FLONG3_425 [Fusarium longipes]|uniref:Uncharacterized protein n=1 Tax=Fusarium longipes TaxID=694270 RepID=A0A395T9E2_9HYPO|nr:hypothetical protein FLONG3_425 [Fusarium longipes]